MEFKVTYWEHNRYQAVADEDDVRGALRGFLEDATEYSDRAELDRARAALAELNAGTVPSDMGIVETALRDNGFEAPYGAKPNGSDSNSDYAVTVKEAATTAAKTDR
jgi:hypothetical protein